MRARTHTSRAVSSRTGPSRVPSSSATGIRAPLEPGENIFGFEIYDLRSLVENKRMQDGTPVEHVSVVFQQAWMAEAERRPLPYRDAASELVAVR